MARGSSLIGLGAESLVVRAASARAWPSDDFAGDWASGVPSAGLTGGDDGTLFGGMDGSSAAFSEDALQANNALTVKASDRMRGFIRNGSDTSKLASAWLKCRSLRAGEENMNRLQAGSYIPTQ